MKLLLDIYKGVSKEQRDKVQLMAAEKKTRAELEELRQQLKKIQESKREDRKKLAEEDAIRKIKQLEEQAYQLQKQVATQKQADGSWTSHSNFHLMRPFVRIFRFWNVGGGIRWVHSPQAVTGRRGSPERNGGYRAGFRRHARTEFETDSAVEGEGRR